LHIKTAFLHSTYFKLLSQIQAHSIRDCGFYCSTSNLFGVAIIITRPRRHPCYVTDHVSPKWTLWNWLLCARADDTPYLTRPLLKVTLQRVQLCNACHSKVNRVKTCCLKLTKWLPMCKKTVTVPRFSVRTAPPQKNTYTLNELSIKITIKTPWSHLHSCYSAS
jgi:hypothetical protein